MLDETTLMSIDGRTVSIRPIHPADADMEANFIERLSLLTKRYRFFGAVKALPAKEIDRLCNVDGHESMALVATVEEGGRPVEIGVCRFAPTIDSDAREMAVTIADTWQKSNLAQILVQRLIELAKQEGVRELRAIELNDNQSMREFAKELGMKAARDPSDATQVIYSLAI